jgi:hypothetical protein
LRRYVLDRMALPNVLLALFALSFVIIVVAIIFEHKRK